MPDSNTSLTSSIQMRGENSTCSSTSYVNELSLPSSFASSSANSSRRDGGGGIVRLGPKNIDGVESGIYQPSITSNNNYSSNQSNNNSGALEIYNASAQGILSNQDEEDQGNEIISANEQDDNSSLTSTDALALRISKETKPMHHLLRLLKDMEPATAANTTGHDPKDRARASLISDFEQEVQVIEHRMKDENMILNGEQPPLPPNWIALEDPDSGDVYYANEATGTYVMLFAYYSLVCVGAVLLFVCVCVWVYDVHKMKCVYVVCVP